MTTSEILRMLSTREISADEATAMMFAERDRRRAEMRPKFVPVWLWKLLVALVGVP